jgi:XTP/dITP diphosphohydrolase
MTDAPARKLVFATRNRGKLAELQVLLANIDGLEVLSLDDIEVVDVVEDGDTFVANASKKALEVSRATGLPALADDSGLEVDALGGAPGVFSARYAGESCDDEANNDKLLAALESVADDQRTGRFRSVLALADVAGQLGSEVLTTEGACEGRILRERRGDGGFGYDPLFYVPELDATFAELGIGPKNNLSHRARAMAAMKPKLLDYLRVAKSPKFG